MAQTYVVSPETGRNILLNGPTYQRLAATKKWAAKLKNAKRIRGTKLSRPRSKPKTSRRSKSRSRARGSSNAGTYKNVRTFCGPAGGAAKGSYPVNSPGRARAALSYARYAPNPEGIKRCVRKQAAKNGWIGSKGRIKVK